MSQLSVVTSDEDGFLNNISGPFVHEAFIICSTTSSSDANENQAFWFFDTTDAVTNIPPTATLFTARLLLYPTSINRDPAEVNTPTYYLFGSSAGAAENGSTLDVGDWGRPANIITTHDFLATELGRWVVFDVPAAYINRSGTTNFRMEAITSDSPGGSVYFDAATSDGGGGNAAILQLHYNIAQGALLAGKP